MGDEQKWNAPGQELSPLDPRDGAQYLLWGEALSDAVAPISRLVGADIGKKLEGPKKS